MVDELSETLATALRDMEQAAAVHDGRELPRPHASIAVPSARTVRGLLGISRSLKRSSDAAVNIAER